MINRTAPETPAEQALTRTEMKILEQLSKGDPPDQKALSFYIIEIAKIGGYLARGNDPPPGNTIMWRGISRLNDIHLGFELRHEICG